MDFPAYVPAPVQAYINDQIEGNDWEPQGWEASLADAEKQLTEIEQTIEDLIRRGKTEHLDALRLQRSDALRHRDMLSGNVNCFRRLAHNERMQDAYTGLAKEFTEDEQWRGFIHAAWAARADYSEYRERLKRVKELRDKIADTSEKLSGLLRDIDEIGFNYWPSEFFSILKLLRTTDNHEMKNHNLRMWRAMRGHVLGDLPQRDVPESDQPQKEGDSTDAPEIIIQFLESGEKPEIDPNEGARNSLRYAWGTAPPLSALLDTVAKAARDFKPSESGMISAAIASRQRSINKEYLRAFGNLLTDIHGFAPTIEIKKAMATVATVVINLPDVDVSYDDVCKAFAKLEENP